MTKKEAIKELQETHDMMRAYNIDSSESILMTALNTAIEALEQEPCEDAVSREDALDILEDYDHDRDEHKENAFADARARMVALPPVTPIRPKGEWETGYTYPDGEYWKCSECGELIKVKFPMNFCNSCGADMRGEKDAT